MPQPFTQRLSLLFVFAAFSFGAVGQTTEVPLERWLRHMQSALPPVFCADGTAIRSCFSLTAQECEKSMFAVTRTCIANMRSEFPATVQLPQQGTKLGGDIGECATDAYAALHRAKYTPTDICISARRQAEEAEKGLK